MPKLGSPVNCPACGSVFRPALRPNREGGERLQKTCSLKCHVVTRDYRGSNNPNYRDGQQHVCDYCHQQFVGKRPRNGRYAGVYCGSRCAALGTTERMRREGSMRGIRNKRDDNEAELVRVAESLGALWIEGEPLDGWVHSSWHGWVPVEVKQPSRRGRKYEFEKSQMDFFKWCESVGAAYWVWYTVDDVLRDLNARVSA